MPETSPIGQVPRTDGRIALSPPPNQPPTPEAIAKELLAQGHSTSRLDRFLVSTNRATRERFLRALELLAERCPRDSAAMKARIRDIFMAVLKHPRAAYADLVMSILGMNRVRQASGKADPEFGEHVLAMFRRPLRPRVDIDWGGMPRLPDLLAESIASLPDGQRRLQELLTGVVDGKVRLPEEYLEAAITTLAVSDARSVDLLKRLLCAPGSQPRIRSLVSALVLSAAPPPKIPGGDRLRTAALAWALEAREINIYASDPLSKCLQENYQDPEALRRLALDMAAAAKDPAVPPGFKRVLNKWASLLSDSAALGITQVARYDAELLAQIIRERKAEKTPDPDRNLVVYVVAPDDHNGALGMEGHWIRKLADGGPRRKNRVLVVEVRTQQEVSEYLRKLGQKVDALFISGHGIEEVIMLSKHPTLGYNNYVEASPDWLKPGYLAPGAVVVFKSCSGGGGGKDNPQNLGNRARQVLDEQGGAPGSTIYSATAPGQVLDIVFDEDGKITNVTYSVPTYQSRRPAPKTPAA